MGLDDPSTLEKLQEKIISSPAFQYGHALYQWGMEKIWPVYSMGMIVAAVSLVGAVHEKQALADHMYGSVPSDQVNQHAEAAQNSLDDETASLVRSEVFTWSRNKFRHEALAADL